ncbi:MAG TPA: hypothetical protein VMP68_29840 [Candidatus Eisenbacteria bacterium]|nr:hypothetical protein [Candidatus Eisenbacteria bacterium]
MKITAVSCFALGAAFLLLAVTQVIKRGWAPLDVTVLDFYFVVLPQHLLSIAGGFVVAGLVATFAPHP